MCMVSGEKTNVEAAHIMPVSCKLSVLKKTLGLSGQEVGWVRNGLFLVTVIHKAFDSLQIAFVKSNPLSTALYLTIIDDECRSNPLFSGSSHTIEDVEGQQLQLGEHKAFLRGLSYHAYQAFLKHNID